jgi:replicative DNA helicase
VYLDARGKYYEKVDREIRSVVDGEGIDLVVLDYIGECRLKKKAQDERLMFKEIAQMFRYSVKDFKRAGVVNSQLTIDDPSKPPTRKNVRECRDIASGAEGVMLGWKPPADVRGKDADGVTEIVKHKAGSRVMLIDKAKGGKCGSVELDWEEKTASFRRTLRPYDEDGYEIPGFEDVLDDISVSLDADYR